jgi:hypothetical protein
MPDTDLDEAERYARTAVANHLHRTPPEFLALLLDELDHLRTLVDGRRCQQCGWVVPLDRLGRMQDHEVDEGGRCVGSGTDSFEPAEPAPAVAVPAETRDAPHDPAHLMYDADTGVCLDCDRIVDPIAAPVAAAFPAAMRAYQDAAEFTEAEDAERVVTAILRAAFRTALKGTS